MLVVFSLEIEHNMSSFFEKNICCEQRGPPRGYGEQRNNIIYFMETGEHKSKNEWYRETNVSLGSRVHR